MAAKTIQQQPVTLTHVSQVTYILYPTGGLDATYAYRPVDETGTPVGETRALTDSKTGPAATEIKNWITTHAVIEINSAEGT
jgi:hypothetical protein